MTLCSTANMCSVDSYNMIWEHVKQFQTYLYGLNLTIKSDYTLPGSKLKVTWKLCLNKEELIQTMPSLTKSL